MVCFINLYINGASETPAPLKESLRPDAHKPATVKTLTKYCTTCRNLWIFASPILYLQAKWVLYVETTITIWRNIRQQTLHLVFII